MKPVLLALCCALIPGGAVHAQDARLAARLPPEALSAVTAVIDSARAAGLPVEPLIEKALEGATKRAAAPRIVVAVRRLAERLRIASATLGEQASETELVSAAAALYAGVDPAALQRLTRPPGGASVALRLVVLTELIEMGVAHDTAIQLITELVSARLPDDALIQLRDMVQRDVRGGTPPEEAGVNRARALLKRSGRGPPLPSMR